MIPAEETPVERPEARPWVASVLPLVSGERPGGRPASPLLSLEGIQEEIQEGIRATSLVPLVRLMEEKREAKLRENPWVPSEPLWEGKQEAG